jgi:proteasome accessory factor B
VVHDDTDGLVVRLEVTNREGFRSWLVSFLDRAEVLGPAELRSEFVTWLRARAGELAT